jgi:hypothetical protein
MKSFRLAIVIAVAISCLCRVSAAQNVYGSTTIDIDPNSGTVTATCETDFDGAMDGNYEAEVVCTVTDQNGTQIANGDAADVDDVGFAQVVLTFSATPGSTYTARGIHHAIAILVEQQFLKTVYEDPYNFSSFESDGNEIYPNYNDWYGPGPEEQTKIAGIRLGETWATQTYQICPTTVTISNTFARSLPSLDHPDSLTGIGILTRMLVSPSVSDYTGVQIRELVTAGPNSCPANVVSYTNFPNLVSTFTVGATANWEGVPFPSVLNSFYDQHTIYLNFDVLGLTSVSSCTATATQIYTCNGQTIGTFTLTNTYDHGSLSGQSVTNITTTKQ